MILSSLPWKQTEIILSFLRLHSSTAFQTVLLTMMAIRSILIISRVEQCCLQEVRVLVVGVSKWLKNKLKRGNRPDVPYKWSGDLIWRYICNFRGRVVRVWAPMACRANSQSSKHYSWKPNCPWRDAINRWTCSRHSVPATHPCRFTERCFFAHVVGNMEDEGLNI